MLTKIKSWWGEYLFYSYNIAMGDIMEGSRLPKKVILARAYVHTLLFEMALNPFFAVVCKMKGHDWVDESYCGPDTGGIDMHCRRCGEHFHEVLY